MQITERVSRLTMESYSMDWVDFGCTSAIWRHLKDGAEGLPWWSGG